MKTEDFINAVFGEATGIATLVTRSPFTKELTDQKFYDYPAGKEDILKRVNQFSQDDVYFSPVLFNEARRIKENSKVVQVVYADADTCHPDNFLLAPSISVQTSEDRWHTYWMLDKPADPYEVSVLAKKIAYAHAHQGCDKSGWNSTKLLRIPNTMNRKEGKDFAIVASSSGEIYSMSQLEDAYGDVAIEPVREAITEQMPEQTPSIMDALGKLQHNPEIVKLYLDEPAVNTDMSKILWKLELELFRAGLSAEEVFTIAKNAKCNKYNHPDRPKRMDADGDLWREVQRAKATFHDTPEPTEVAPLEPEVVVQDNEVLPFLTEDERYTVQEYPNFVKEYCSWASSKTDGAIEYQVASAFTVLSSVYSDLGYAVPRYGKMGLNLWFMVLGETTLTRKSTSRQLMLRVVREYEKYCGYQIDIGSDATPEGVTSILSERGNKTSLLHRDEVQGMFKDFINKTYMASAAERFTELYDGHVPVVIRSSKDKAQTKRTETNFIMYLMGITSKVADVLTTEYFRSGFLARFLYVVADSPQRTKESEDIQQADEYEVNVRDKNMEAMIKSLFESVTFWQKKGGQRPMRMTDAALKRFNDFKWEMGNFAETHSEKESIEPSRQRLALSVWKISVLLAMHERSELIETRHVITSIYYAQDWFKNLIRMAKAISASEWQRDVDRLEALVSDRGGRVRYEEAYRKFSHKKKREFDEMVEALSSQARVRTAVENRKSYLEVVN